MCGEEQACKYIQTPSSWVSFTIFFPSGIVVSNELYYMLINNLNSHIKNVDKMYTFDLCTFVHVCYVNKKFTFWIPDILG